MDSDPFAVWDEPAASKTQHLSVERLSLQDAQTSNDDDPGWGLPSPQKTRQNTKLHIEQDVPLQDIQTQQQYPKVQSPDDDDFDDDDGFQEFNEPAQGNDSDDFGDFDDFEQGVLGQDEPAAEPEEQQSTIPPTTALLATPRTWSAIKVSQGSRRDDVAADVANLLPLSILAEQELSRDVLRQVADEAQVLVAESSRTMWTGMCAMPSVKPIDWVRSKTRRDYLISMGIPVNLDEIHYSAATGRSSAGGLPPLKLDLGTADSAPRLSNASISRSTTPSRNDTASPAGGASSIRKERMVEKRREELGLAPPPDVDLARAQELVDKTESQLTLMSLPALKSLLREMHALTTATSVLLTHHLTMRESYQADSEMYNSMIKQLVTGAATRVSGATNNTPAHGLRGGAVDRRATTIASASSLPRHPTPPTRSASINRSSPSLRGGAGSR